MQKEDLFARMEAKLSQLYQIYENTDGPRKFKENTEVSVTSLAHLTGLSPTTPLEFNLPYEPVMDLATSGCTSDCYEVEILFTLGRISR